MGEGIDGLKSRAERIHGHLEQILTCRACLSHSKSLSDEENLKLFGKCNNPNGHGHNYKGRKLISILAAGVMLLSGWG